MRNLEPERGAGSTVPAERAAAKVRQDSATKPLKKALRLLADLGRCAEDGLTRLSASQQSGLISEHRVIQAGLLRPRQSSGFDG